MAITSLLLLLASALLPLALAAAPPPALRSAERSFTLSLRGLPARVFPMFGPLEERKWDPDWRPVMLYQEGPAGHPSFAVFRVLRGGDELTWVISAYDPARHFIQYVNVNPGKMVTMISIACAPEGADRTRAAVTYRRTALRAENNADIEHFEQHFASEGPHWERAINDYLATLPADPGKN